MSLKCQGTGSRASSVSGFVPDAGVGSVLGAGWGLIGVWHSHTHTPAYPSPTDVAQAPDPDWHYVLVSLSDIEPVVRSYRIVAGQVEEEFVVSSV